METRETLCAPTPRHDTSAVVGKSIHDQSTDLYGDEDALADEILAEFDREYDVDVSVNLAKLFQRVRLTHETPDYFTICDVTGCSSKNRNLKFLYWSASNRFRILYSAYSNSPAANMYSCETQYM